MIKISYRKPGLAKVGTGLKNERVRFNRIIVGGGSAGCALAARLSQDPDRSVLLLEAGPDFESLRTFPEILLGRNESWVEDQFTWSYDAELTSDPGSVGTVYRGRVIGGSGSVNGAVFLRGLPEDFELWNSPHWTWEQVLRCYKRSETDLDFGGDLHGSSGPVPVLRTPRASWAPLYEAFYRACCEAGHSEATDLNDPNQSGVGPIPKNRRGGVRINAAIAYLEPARERPNLVVRGDSIVSRVLFEGHRAIGVEVVGNSGVYRVEADMVVVCAGALATPLLLMRSGIGAAPALRKLAIPVVQDMPGVGARLQDHALVKIVLRPRDDRPFPRPDEPGRFQSMLVYSASTGGFRKDMHVMPAYLSDSIVLAPDLLFELSSGSVELRSADQDTPPRIRYQFLSDPIDRERLREAVLRAVEIAESRAMGEVVVGRLSPMDGEISSAVALDGWLQRNVATGFHSSGTCPIGKSGDGFSVVDDSCRVHGVDGLAIADLSIMPNTVRANTNATAIMIGERAAELLA